MNMGNPAVGAAYLAIGVCIIVLIWVSWQILKLILSSIAQDVADRIAGRK